MKNAKKEVIKKAYGEYWEDLCDDPKFKVKDIVDKNGWISIFAYDKIKDFDYKDNSRNFYRPKSLRGIETNNEWIRIESEDDLPNDNGSYFTKTNYCKEIIKRDYPTFIKSISIEDERKWWLKYVTHYQPIIKPEPPIY